MYYHATLVPCRFDPIRSRIQPFSYVVFFLSFFNLILGGETLWTIWSGNAERERERKKIEGRIPRVEVSANICHSCAGIFASSHSSYPPFLVLRWACYHCTDRFLGWKIANRFGLAWISRGKDGDCIDFSIRDGFSYLERIINGPRFSAFPTTDRLVRSVKYSRNCFLPSFFSSPSSSCFFSNEIIPVQIILIYVTYSHLSLSRFTRKI